MQTNDSPKHCAETNSDLFSMFSDTYKEHNGMRPRYFITEAEVIDWMLFFASQSSWEFSRMIEKRMIEDMERQYQDTIRNGSHPAFSDGKPLVFSPFAMVLK